MIILSRHFDFSIYLESAKAVYIMDTLNAFRIDLLDCGQPEKVPCGMNTIVYMQTEKPSVRTVKGILVAAGDWRKVAICSIWKPELNDYQIYGSYTLESLNVKMGA